MGEDALHIFFGLTHRQTTDRHTIKIHGFQTRERFIAQRFKHATLDNRKQGIRIFFALKFVQ